jgi:hypothetical protein
VPDGRYRYRPAVVAFGLLTVALGAATSQYPPDLLVWAQVIGGLTMVAGVLALLAAVLWRRPLLYAAGTAMICGTMLRAVALAGTWITEPTWIGAGGAIGMTLATTALLLSWASILAVRPSTLSVGGQNRGIPE